MSGNATETQWYIARDGKQHGPLTDTELRLFVQGGHLKATDLIWKPGLPDWRPAPVVFPTLNEGNSQTESQSTDDASNKFSPGIANPIGAASGSAGLAETSSAPAPTASLSGGQQHQAVSTADASAAKLKQSVVLKVGGLLAAAAAVGVIGWAVLGNSNGTPSSSSDADLKVITAPETTKTAATAAVDPYESLKKPAPKKPEETVQDRSVVVDADLQNSQMWRLLKKDYPKWYAQRLQDIVKMQNDQKQKTEVATHVVNELVALRRKHAEQALAANTDRLIAIAQTFLENLKQLASVDKKVCYSFISQGETSPSVIALNPEKGYSETVERQIVAIFEAISDGRRSPKTRLRAQKPDYDRLAEQLGRLGWSQSDLQLFADPGALGKAPPERVCKMVQDWFAAHIAVGDKETKDRLLFETLRPVIAG